MCAELCLCLSMYANVCLYMSIYAHVCLCICHGLENHPVQFQNDWMKTVGEDAKVDWANNH